MTDVVYERDLLTKPDRDALDHSDIVFVIDGIDTEKLLRVTPRM